MLEDLASLKLSVKPAKPKRMVQWQRPELGWVKVNTDASFDPNSFTGSAGVVIHDHAGMVVSGAARWFDGVPDVLAAKALAAKEGLELALEMGYERVLLEVDCNNLKTLLEDRSCMRSSSRGLCFDIIELGRSFNEFRVEWVCREANSVAHCYACMVTATERSFFWRDCVPVWLTELAATNCTTPIII
jgi:ribonuclease HI